jgi:excisionase family DNA binding protein
VNASTDTPQFARVDDLDEVRQKVVHRDTVYRLIREGRCPVIKLSSRQFLVPKDWASRLLENAE